MGDSDLLAHLRENAVDTARGSTEMGKNGDAFQQAMAAAPGSLTRKVLAL